MIDNKTFFTEIIDTKKHPKLLTAKEKAEKGDFKTAKTEFANYIRNTLNPELFFSITEIKSDNLILYPNETLEQAGKRILTHELISTGTPHKFGKEIDWSANPTENQYREWTWQLNRHADIQILANRYLETKEEAYAKCAVEFFSSWVKQATIPADEVPGYETECWRTIEAGIRMGLVWPYALHALYKSEAFTDDIIVEWYKSLWEHGTILRKKHRIGNWLIIEMHGLFYVGLLNDIFVESQAWKQYAITKLEEELDNQIHPDGFQYELSTGYHNVVLDRYADIVTRGMSYGITLPESFKDKIANMYDLYGKLVMPDGVLPDLNDGRWEKASKYMAITEKLYPEREDYKYFRTNRQEGQKPEYTSLYLNYSGIAIMREGWEKESIWALVDVGPFGRGHQHEDKLQMLLHAYGHLLLAEYGNYAYDTSEMRKYALATRSHNTIRVDNNGQNRRHSYKWEDTDIKKECDSKWTSNEEYDIVTGIYNDGYGEKAAIKVKHERTVIFAKQLQTKCFIVIDKLYPEDNEEHEYEVLWHLMNREYEIRNNKVISYEENKPTLTVITPLNSLVETKVVIGQTSPNLQGWRPVELKEGSKAMPSPCIIHEAKAKGAIRLCTLLIPSQHNEDIVKELHASTDINSKEIRIVFSNGKEITITE